MAEAHCLLPPEGFARVRLPLVRMRPTNLMRIHTPDIDACHFGTSGEARFDDPDRRFGVFYGGIGLACCIAETVLGERWTGQVEPPALAPRDLADHLVCRAELPPGADLALVDLTGAGLLQLGADARIEAEADYRASQLWSRAFWSHPDRPDGILYRSRYDGACQCIALYDRVRRQGLATRPEGRLLDHPDLDAVLRRYRITLREPRRSGPDG